MRFDGSLTLDFLDPGLESPVFTGSNVAIVLSPGGSASLGTLRLRGGLTGTLTMLLTDPETAASQIFAIKATAGLGIGTLAPFQPRDPIGPQLSVNTLPIPGTVRLCLLNNACNVAVPIPLTEAGGSKGLGVGGLIAASGLNGFINVSIQAAPWTLNTATVAVATTSGGTGTVFAFGFAHGPSSFTGSTANAGGLVNLVTPMAITATQGPNLSGFARLKLRFVPEPSFLASLASCVVGLLALDRIRMKR